MISQLSKVDQRRMINVSSVFLRVATITVSAQARACPYSAAFGALAIAAVTEHRRKSTTQSIFVAPRRSP